MSVGHFLRFFLDIQFWIAVIIGWYLAGKFHILYTIEERDALQECPQCLKNDCGSCEKFEVDINNKQIRNVHISKSFYRQYPFKPLNVNEDMLSRWKVMSSTHQYEMLNQEPRIGLNAMWRLEQLEVANFAFKKITENSKNLPFAIDDIQFNHMHRRTDPFYGTSYIVQVLYNKKTDQELSKHLSVLDVHRPFVQGKPHVLNISLEKNEKVVNIISPISAVSERFRRYLNNLSKTLRKSSNLNDKLKVKLVFVIFLSENEEETNKVVKDFKDSNPNIKVNCYYLTGKFNRAVGLNEGVKHCNDDDLMLFMDVDLSFSDKFLKRVQRNTIQHKTVLFPVVFSQYDPAIIDAAADRNAFPKSLVKDKNEINKQTGFWLHFGFGIVSMYKSDYKAVGGFKLDIEGWGGEDVDLFQKFIAHKEIKVMNTVDPDLAHMYHKRGCDPNLSPDQTRMCFGSWSNSLASQLEIAAIYNGKRR